MIKIQEFGYRSMEQDYEIFKLGDIALQSGEMLPGARLAYKTYGELSPKKDNAVLLPTFYTGTHQRNEGFFGPGRAIDPAKHFIISINMFGNGLSSSPSNSAPLNGGPRFSKVSLFDNIACQQRLLSECFGTEKLALVTGWSMAGCQAYQWAAQYPDRVKAILPFCASAKASDHNIVFLEGVKAALCADGQFHGGDYAEPPKRGLAAFGRVYAGWAFSQSFYRQKLYQELGFQTLEELLVDWENDHIENWDANDLLSKLDSWQRHDISANPLYQGDFLKALGAIKARTLVIACNNDLYFRPEDNEIEVKHIQHAEMHIYNSPWGHCVANPGNDPKFAAFLDHHINRLMGE